MSWWETLHLVTWWKRLGISAIKTGQVAPSWIWCTERLSFFGGGHIVLQRFVHVRCHFQPLPTKLVFAYFDRGSYVTVGSYGGPRLRVPTGRPGEHHPSQQGGPKVLCLVRFVHNPWKNHSLQFTRNLAQNLKTSFLANTQKHNFHIPNFLLNNLVDNKILTNH